MRDWPLIMLCKRNSALIGMLSLHHILNLMYHLNMEHNISLLDPHEPVLNPSSKSILVPKLNHILFLYNPLPLFFLPSSPSKKLSVSITESR